MELTHAESHASGATAAQAGPLCPGGRGRPSRAAAPSAERDGARDAQELIGRRVRIIAWYDHAQLIAARTRGEVVGTITQVMVSAGVISVSVLLDRLCGMLTLRLSDVELLS